MATYTIIGGDKKEYAYVTADSVRQWITEGRLNAQSLAKSEGDVEWRTLALFPEFADLLVPQAPSPIASAELAPSTNFLERDYELDISRCVSRGWELFKNNMGLLFVTVLIYMLIEGAIAGFSMIPFVGSLFSIANMVIAGPLMGGLFFVFIRTVRGQAAESGDVFMGFRKSFVQLFLGHLIPALLAGLCVIPAVIVLIIMIVPAIVNGAHGAGGHPDLSPTAIAIVIAAFLVCLVPMIFLAVCWSFTLPPHH